MSKDYLKDVDAGIEITLAKPADVSGAKVSILVMREPTVRDQEAAQMGNNGNAASAEIQLMANLLEITADDVRNLTLRNYKRVQAAIDRFTD